MQSFWKFAIQITYIENDGFSYRTTKRIDADERKVTSISRANDAAQKNYNDHFDVAIRSWQTIQRHKKCNDVCFLLNAPINMITISLQLKCLTCERFTLINENVLRWRRNIKHSMMFCMQNQSKFDEFTNPKPILFERQFSLKGFVSLFRIRDAIYWRTFLWCLSIMKTLLKGNFCGAFVYTVYYDNLCKNSFIFNWSCACLFRSILKANSVFLSFAIVSFFFLIISSFSPTAPHL